MGPDWTESHRCHIHQHLVTNAQEYVYPKHDDNFTYILKISTTSQKSWVCFEKN